MTRLLALLAGCALLGCSRASSAAESAAAPTLSTIEQYCFPKSNGLFSTNNMFPTVTVVYSGVTLTTTPITLTMSRGVPTAALSEVSSNRDPIPASSIVSPLATLSQSTVASGSGIPLAASHNTLLGASETVTGSEGGTGNPSTLNSVQDPMTSSVSVAAPEASLGSGSPFVQSSITLSTGNNGLETALISSSTTSMSVSQNTATSDLVNGMQSDVTSGSILPASTGGASAVSSQQSATTAVGAESPSSSIGMVDSSTTTGMPDLADGAANRTFDSLNGTLEISPAALDALHLAQFLKNLGVYMFNTSNLGADQVLSSESVSTSFASVIGNISLVCLRILTAYNIAGDG